MNDDEHTAAHVAAYICLLIVVIAGLSLGFMKAGHGHSFYDAYCCSGQDCEPIDEKRVKLAPGGYLLDDKFYIPEAQARQAPDGNYHACFWPGPNDLRCFYKPMLGS